MKGDKRSDKGKLGDEKKITGRWKKQTNDCLCETVGAFFGHLRSLLGAHREFLKKRNWQRKGTEMVLVYREGEEGGAVIVYCC